MSDTGVNVSVEWVADDTERIYEYLNRRWKEETGSYPAGDEPMIMVMVVSILAEFHDQVCPHLPESTYAPAIPDQSRRGSLRCGVWLEGARRALGKGR